MDLGDLALWVIGAEDDGVELGVGVEGRAVREVLVAYEVDDEVYAGDDDTAESEGEEEEGDDEPDGLWRRDGTVSSQG